MANRRDVEQLREDLRRRSNNYSQPVTLSPDELLAVLDALDEARMPDELEGC